ncbi:MAG TPA: D-alanyl-D-alanine carboxypeptidase [Acetobacteraceae bacterium]|nr:D-alanyl-D-alanine carboxypeptidase [Acetobacteraceae bacterium]
MGFGTAAAGAQSTDADRYGSIVIEAASGKVLEQESADAARHPASLAKLMTLYLTFEALRDRRISLDEQVPISPHAASMEPTKLGLVPGTPFTVEQAILGMVTLSANDAAAAMGELLGGSEDRFGQMMTLRAHALGMSRSSFANASGLPAPDQWTTARDMALLARRLIADFPDDYHYFSTPSFVFHHRLIRNHDTELKTYLGADGLKTGYTIASGHNLVTSAVRNGWRLIGVVLGANSNATRDLRMTALLDSGYQDLGVPPERGTMVASRLPALIPAAHADELPRAARPPRVREIVHLPAETAVWAIQVGLYHTEQAARLAAVKARHVTDDGDAHTSHTVFHGRPTWRAQVIGLTRSDARDACHVLSRKGTPCAVIRVATERNIAQG